MICLHCNEPDTIYGKGGAQILHFEPGIDIPKEVLRLIKHTVYYCTNEKQSRSSLKYWVWKIMYYGW